MFTIHDSWARPEKNQRAELVQLGGGFKHVLLWTQILGEMVLFDYPWTPKPWNMKVLNPQYMGYNPKNEGCGFPW